MNNRYFTVSLGQGQANLATKMLKEAQTEGNWIYIANCHLLLNYLPTLEKMILQLGTAKLHKDFRLMLSSMSTPGFPVTILQNSIKITTETPKGLKANLRKLYSLVLQEGVHSSCDKQSKYLKLLFSLSFFHSVLTERRKFQNLGWNVVYNFNESDFKMSEQILRVYLDMYDYTPWDAIKHLIVDISYGGHITDLLDVRLLDVYFQQFFSDEALVIPQFLFSSVPTYYMPSDGPIESYIEYIESLPQEEPAEVFGQNSNAEISFRVQEALFLFENLLKAHPAKVATVKKSLEDTVLDIIESIRKESPESINEGLAIALLQKSPSPIHHVLLQETKRYNVLINLIQSSLQQLEDGIKGTNIMTPEIEVLFTTIQHSQVPQSWLKSYPSVKPLGAYIKDLKLRVEQIADWVQYGEPPVQLWLSGFTTPNAVLNAHLQIAARQSDVLFHDLKWEFVVSALDDAHITDPPEEGLYVRGLFLEGAGWDKKHCFLAEPKFMHLVTPMPVIHFKPSHDVNTRGTYHCPCYYIPKRNDLGCSNYVMSIDLKSRKPQVYWVKRGTALLMNNV